MTSVGRHPGDVLRVAIGTGVTIAGAWIARSGRVGTAETDMFQLVNRLPGWLEPPLTVVMQAGSLAMVAVAAGAAATARRGRMAVDLALSGGVAWAAARGLKALVLRGRPSQVLLDVVERGQEQIGFGYPSGHAATAAALATAASPYLPRPVRRALWGVVALVGVARIFVGAHLPLDIVGGWALGWAVGALVHLARGAPRRLPTPEDVLTAARVIGVPVVAVSPVLSDARGSTPFRLSLEDGSEAFAKLVSAEQRDADLLFKLWRYAVYRSIEDEAPFATPKQQIEHEAYVSLLAERAGVRVPGLLAAGEAGRRTAILVQTLVPRAHGLDELSADDVDNDLLRGLWEQVGVLHRARVAHRDLRVANVLVDDQRRPWLVDFGYGEGAASARRLAHDVAELLAATAAVVGTERAARVAATVVEPSVLSEAARLLQPLALSTATRHQTRGQLHDLRGEVERSTGRELGPLEPVTRIRIRLRTIATLLVVALGIHLLLPQLAELEQIASALRGARVEWLMAGAAGSAVTYVAAAVSLLGAVGAALPLGRTIAVQVAASFASRLAPGSVGGLALNERYLERTGISRTAALSAVGADAAAGAVVHLALLAVSVAAFGTAEAGSLRIPRGWPLLLAVAAVGVTAAIVAGLPWTRRRLVRPAFAAFRGLGGVVRQPAKAAALFGGSAALTLVYILTLVASLRAFGADVAPVHVATVYLVGHALGSVSPTPGGLGVVEAALVAGLTGLGVQTGAAVAGVLSFRLLTFWLPILPGGLLFRRLQTEHAI